MNRFQKGDRIEMNEHGLKHNPSYSGRKGVVANKPRTDFLLSVRLDGNKSVMVWHVDCWRKAAGK